MVILSATHLAVRYRNGALGVADASFSVDAGEIVALFGANGAGKTTSVRAVTGFLRSEGARVEHGAVTLFGRDMTNAEPHKISGLGVAFVPERSKIFPHLSVADNLVSVGHLPPRRRRAEVSAFIYELFPALADRHGVQAGRLSGGQQQMLAIGRCLMTGPQLLILDEMTLGLHHSMHQVLFDAVRHVSDRGTAVLLVDESTGLALQLASRAYLLSGGVVIDEGPAERFRGSELLAAGYLGQS